MLLKGVFWTNNRKHGFIRGTIGGYLMYPSIVVFLIFEVLFLKILTRVLLVFNIKALDKKDFVDYGRICCLFSILRHWIKKTLSIMAELIFLIIAGLTG